MRMRCRSRSVLFLLGVIAGCGGDGLQVVEVGNEGEVTVQGHTMSLGDFATAQMADTMVIVGRDSALFKDINALMDVLCGKGIHYVGFADENRGSDGIVTLRLSEPKFEFAEYPYNVLHITMDTDQRIHVLRGEASMVQHATEGDIQAIVASEWASNPAVVIGLNATPDVTYAEYFPILRALTRNPPRRTIVNAPLPGSRQAASGWWGRNEKGSVFFCESGSTLSRASDTPGR